MRRFLSAAIVAVLSLAVVSRAAYGTALLKLNDNGGNSITIDETGAIVASTGVHSGTTTGSGIGLIIYNGTLGSKWTVNVDVGASTGSALVPSLDIGGTNVSSSKPATLTISFTMNNLGSIPPGANFFLSTFTGSQPTGDTASAKLLYDNTNGLGFTGTLIGGPYAQGTIDAPSSTVGPAGSYSLTQVLFIDHTNRIGLSSVDYRLEGQVPEPASLLLLGSGLAGFAYLRRQKNKR